MKNITFLLIIIQLTTLNSVSKPLEENENRSLKWEILEKNYEDNRDNSTYWEIVPKKEILRELDETFQEQTDINNLFSNLDLLSNTEIYEITPIIPLNNFIKNDEIETSIEWKSSFGGGKAGGIGQQNNSLKIDYGLSKNMQLTGYFSEADDDTYNYINGARAQYSWQNYAISLKKSILKPNNGKNSLSSFASIEYWRLSSGSDYTKSIYNEIDNSLGKDRFNKIIGSFSLPFSHKITNDLEGLLVPGITFLPEKFGNKTSRSNGYGENIYLGTGLLWKLSDNFKLTSSFTMPLGKGNNYFDKNLNFSKKPIYSFGLNWDLNKKISLETKITNGYGSTPATGLLTIPSDNLPLYAANFKYNPYGKDTYLKPLETRDKLISFGGITVNNALIPSNGTGQYSFDLDSNGNYNTSYSYSLSNIFQLELINLGAINNASNNTFINENFTNTYLDKNNFNIRLGGKFLLFSPQKNDILWTSLRTSVGRNESSNQGYVFSELINTYRVNNWLAANLTSKYFYSGIEQFGAFGGSIYLNLSDNLQIIPEINYLLDKKMQSNNTISVRYSFSEDKSIDLYLSNSLSSEDLSQLLRSKNNRFGIKLNLLY